MVTPRQRPTDRQLPVNGLSTPGAHIQTRQPVSGTTVTPERTAETRWRLQYDLRNPALDIYCDPDSKHPEPGRIM
ncbi:hypothetical protein ABVT39_022313 [Epinephelus coioides]